MQLLYPINGIGTIPGESVSQYFGVNAFMYAPYKGHMGIDFGCATGTPVMAAHDGTVHFKTDLDSNGKIDGYGHYVYCQSIDNSFATIYGHLKSFIGVDGRQVKAGEVIALSNNTGDSTGPHLHFGLQFLPVNMNNGYAGCSDPLPYLKGFAMLVFFKIKGTPTIWSLIDGMWVGFSDINAFNKYVNGRAMQVIELDQQEFNKIQSSPNVFKT